MPMLTNQRSRLLGGSRKWWLAGGAPTPIAVYQPKGASSLAASYTNLANNGAQYNAAPGTAPTFDTATGWTFDGLTQYLQAGTLVPADGWSMVVRFTDAATNARIAGSEDAGDTRFGFRPNESTTIRYGQGQSINVSPALTAGVIAVAGQRGYRNGTAEGAAIGAWSGTSTRIIQIGAYLIGGSRSFASVKIQALAIYNTTLTAPQVAAVSAAMALL